MDTKSQHQIFTNESLLSLNITILEFFRTSYSNSMSLWLPMELYVLSHSSYVERLQHSPSYIDQTKPQWPLQESPSPTPEISGDNPSIRCFSRLFLANHWHVAFGNHPDRNHLEVLYWSMLTLPLGGHRLLAAVTYSYPGYTSLFRQMFGNFTSFCWRFPINDNVTPNR